MKLTESLRTHLTDLISSTKEEIQEYDSNISRAEKEIVKLKQIKQEAQQNIACLESILNDLGSKNEKKKAS